MLNGTFRFHLILMKQPAFTLRLKAVKRELSLFWSKRRFLVTSCPHLQEKRRKKCEHPACPRKNLIRLLRMELLGRRTKRNESRSWRILSTRLTYITIPRINNFHWNVMKVFDVPRHECHPVLDSCGSNPRIGALVTIRDIQGSINHCGSACDGQNSPLKNLIPQIIQPFPKQFALGRISTCFLEYAQFQFEQSNHGDVIQIVVSGMKP